MRQTSSFKKSMRRTRSGRFRYKKSLMSTPFGPWLMLGGITFAIILAIVLCIAFVVPAVKGWLGISPEAQGVTQTQGTTPAPTAKRHPIESVDFNALQKEVVVKQQYIADPFFFNDNIYYTAGKDNVGGPKMANLYLYNIEKQSEEQVADVELKNDDLFQPQKNEKFLVWVDSKRAGGGNIMAKASTGQSFIVRTYYAGLPKIVLEGDTLLWIERTGSRMDKLFICDLNTQENATLAMFENSVYGMSDVSAFNKTVAWAEEEPAPTEDGGEQSVVRLAKLDGKGGQPDILSPHMYVHDPVTNGEVVAFIDSNHEENSKLYIMKVKGQPQLVEEGVLHYAMGSDFLVYSKDHKIFIYIWEYDVRKQITPELEQAMLIGVSSDTVLWYQLGQERDILKYASIAGIE